MRHALIWMVAMGLGVAGCGSSKTAATTVAGPTESAKVAEILRRPESVDPFEYADVVRQLWDGGRRQQAAFWFYIFQERSKPWSEADTHGDGANALRASLNETLGQTINGWIASDPAAWRTLVERALSYEKKFPLYSARPEGVTAEAWTTLVEKSRVEYDAQAREAFATLDPVDVARTRRANGLPVGPLEAPGPALLEAWR